MYYPMLDEEKSTRETINVFGGYNHNAVISDGEFYEMTNMTSDNYPTLSVRGKRTKIGVNEDGAVGNVLVVEGRRIYIKNTTTYDGETICSLQIGEAVVVDDFGGTTLNPGVKHQLTQMGAYLVIFPEGVYINLTNQEDRGSLVRERSPEQADTNMNAISIRNCDRDGKIIDIQWWQAKDPEWYTNSGDDKTETPDIADGDYWLKPVVVNDFGNPTEVEEEPIMYIRRDGEWEPATETYVRLSFDTSAGVEWFTQFKDNDYVTLQKFPVWYKGEAYAGAIDFSPWINGTHVLVKSTVENGYVEIVIKGISGGTDTNMAKSFYSEDEGAKPTVGFVIPVLDYVTACANRLWGCRYGKANNGEFVNEIYATALGDIHRWYNYSDGSDADNSWTAGVGHMGNFTGAATYGGHPYFFKTDRIYAIYGNSTTSFGYTELTERGVQKGSNGSLCVLDGILYYQTSDGIVAFDGSTTVLVSAALGSTRYSNAVAGGSHGKLYISMKDEKGNYHLFVYDVRRGLWHREDGLCVVSMAVDDVGRLFCVKDDGSVVRINRAGDDGDEDDLCWMVESGIIGLDDPDKKYISRLSLRLSVDVGARVTVSIQYDSVGAFEPVWTYEGISLKTMTLPVMPQRCDHFRLRIEGKGNVRIYGITKTIETGSAE